MDTLVTLPLAICICVFLLCGCAIYSIKMVTDNKHREFSVLEHDLAILSADIRRIEEQVTDRDQADYLRYQELDLVTSGMLVRLDVLEDKEPVSTITIEDFDKLKKRVGVLAVTAGFKTRKD